MVENNLHKLPENIWEVKCLSLCMNENIFIFPEHLRGSLLGNRTLEQNFQRFENFHRFLDSLKSDAILIPTCDLFLSLKF